jgi:hypothetical protein
MAHVTFVFTQNMATFAFCFPSKRRFYAIHTGFCFVFFFLSLQCKDLAKEKHWLELIKEKNGILFFWVLF